VANRKSIFITGGGSGIGRATAQYFGAQGWFVGLADVNVVGISETAALLPEGQSSQHEMDVRDRAQWTKALAAFWMAAEGRLDVMFNNAGIARGGAFSDVPSDDNDLLIAINFSGVIKGAEAALPYLKQTPGSCLLNTCSASGIVGAPGLAVYSATKFAVRGLSEALDAEWVSLGIKVRTIMPSYIDTPLLDVTTSGRNSSAREEVVRIGLEFTPVAKVAEAAWRAVHSRNIHTVVGKTAHELAFGARFMPSLLRKRIRKTMRA